MEVQNVEGLVTLRSSRTVDEVVASLSAILNAKGITLFALVDHSGEAEKAGFTMRPTKLLIFGDPKAGTPLMLASITSAIDLPLKILIWQDEAGTTQLTYNSPEWLGSRHNIPSDQLKNIAGIGVLAAKAAQ